MIKGGHRRRGNMAKITIVSMAFWGDVMPFVPVANELAARGHDMTFAVPEGFPAPARPHPQRHPRPPGLAGR
jgi:UDP:flavonoid glycosyltransferase YjiC (YdhE family)